MISGHFKIFSSALLKFGYLIQKFLFAECKCSHIGHRDVGADGLSMPDRIDMPVYTPPFAILAAYPALECDRGSCARHGFL